MEHNPVHLVLDVGNSRTKAALYQGAGRVIRWTHLANGDQRGLHQWLDGLKLAHAVVGSVADHDPELGRYLAACCPVLQVSGSTPTPLRNTYTSQGTLGADRLANAVGAAMRFAGRPVLAVDAGTCVTYDLVDADSTYLGGAIAPGLKMRAKAMHGYSARLPLVEPGPVPSALGIDTLTSLAAGIHHGMLGEVLHFIDTYGHQRGGMAVVLTGGDALRIASALKSGIFAHPLLTLEGLHAILLHDLGLDPNAGGASANHHPGPGATG